MNIREIVLLCAVLVIAGCTTALPNTDKAALITPSIDAAEHWAQEAKSRAEEAQRDAERSAQMLAEAREMLRRAEEAGAKCRALEAKLGKQPKVRYVPAPKVVQEPVQTPASQVTPVPTPAPADPDYAPSDAPEGYTPPTPSPTVTAAPAQGGKH
jgi:hypothetical protein